jgi:hypothetical protein
MDRAAALAHSELLANLRATFADARHGEAAFTLAEELGARAILADAADSRDASVRRRAQTAIDNLDAAGGRGKMSSPAP